MCTLIVIYQGTFTICFSVEPLITFLTSQYQSREKIFSISSPSYSISKNSFWIMLLCIWWLSKISMSFFGCYLDNIFPALLDILFWIWKADLEKLWDLFFFSSSYPTHFLTRMFDQKFHFWKTIFFKLDSLEKKKSGNQLEKKV